MKHFLFILSFAWLTGCTHKPVVPEPYFVPYGSIPGASMAVTLPPKNKIEIVLPEVPYAN